MDTIENYRLPDASIYSGECVKNAFFVELKGKSLIPKEILLLGVLTMDMYVDLGSTNFLMEIPIQAGFMVVFLMELAILIIIQAWHWDFSKREITEN